MLKYGPTKNIATDMLINIPNRNTPDVLIPNINPEKPNAVNTNPIIVDTTVEITQVIITNPTYVKMQSNQPISSIISLISLNANAFDNWPSLYIM